MAAVFAFGRPVAGVVSSRPGRLRDSFADAASGKLGSNGLCPRAAHAEIVGPDESADSPCHQRYHWGYGTGDRRCDCSGKHEPRRISEAAGLPNQSVSGNGDQEFGWGLSCGTHLYVEAIVKRLPLLPATDYRLRSGSSTTHRII